MSEKSKNNFQKNVNKLSKKYMLRLYQKKKK
jgi:hypothetical protein